MKDVNESKNFKKEWDKVKLGVKTSFREKLTREYDTFVDCKINNKQLPPRYKDHELNDNRAYKDCRDAHLSGDTVVIYKENETTIELLHVGSHSNLLEEKELSK